MGEDIGVFPRWGKDIRISLVRETSGSSQRGNISVFPGEKDIRVFPSGEDIRGFQVGENIRIFPGRKT